MEVFLFCLCSGSLFCPTSEERFLKLGYNSLHDVTYSVLSSFRLGRTNAITLYVNVRYNNIKNNKPQIFDNGHQMFYMKKKIHSLKPPDNYVIRQKLKKKHENRNF